MIWYPKGVRDFSLLHSNWAGSGAQPAALSVDPEQFFPKDEAAQGINLTTHSHGAEFKNIRRRRKNQQMTQVLVSSVGSFFSYGNDAQSHKPEIKNIPFLSHTPSKQIQLFLPYVLFFHMAALSFFTNWKLSVLSTWLKTTELCCQFLQ